jgi:hypothetical protein
VLPGGPRAGWRGKKEPPALDGAPGPVARARAAAAWCGDGGGLELRWRLCSTSNRARERSFIQPREFMA